jgi:hypothetical protein
MGLNSNNVQSASSFKPADPLEPGAYPARLVVVADLGVQAQRPYQGEEKADAQEILVVYEILDEFMKDDSGHDIEDKPRWVNEIFPLHSLRADLAKSTKRYKAIDPQGNVNGDWSQLVGEPCMVTLVQNQGKGASSGRIFNNVAAVSPMRAKEADIAPDLVNPSVVFDFDEPDLKSFERLPSWIQEKVKVGVNFPGSKLDALLGGKVYVEEVNDQSDNDESPF